MNDSEKPYKLTLEQRTGYLYALIEAKKITREMALSYTHEIADKCAEIDCHLVLIERKVPVIMATGNLFFATQDFTKLMEGKKVAFVNPHRANDDGMRLAMTIGNNRGARFETHPTVEAAEKWLLGCVSMVIMWELPVVVSHLAMSSG
jgi:hypothetical protein